ncbi:MAG: UDP-2,3-diacylglucosamine diphosphatase [Burkholderiales bacterium]
MSFSLFISDLHLSQETPAANQALQNFLDSQAREASALYVLGDLFEYWIGDDSLDGEFAPQICAAFARLASQGVKLFFMHGNRDFMIGARFARESGMSLLDDPCLIDLHGKPTLLMHGDTLCTDDFDYQKFRATVRSVTWQGEFLAKSPAERSQIAQQARQHSELAKQTKQTAIMDVNLAAVEAVLRQHGYPRIIHGHTHRPARHLRVVDGNPCERFVLADWYSQGSYLICDENGCRALPVN